jgi:hypothetical protein
MRSTTRHDPPSDSDGIYESFSDMVLCTLIVLITLVVVLALNVVEQLNVYLEPNHYSGGATRPWLYLQAQNTDYSRTTSDHLALERAVYGNRPFVMVNLFSPSSAQSATTVQNGRTVSAKQGQSFQGQCDLTAYNFLQLAAGIEPGSFPVNGSQTALMLPKFSHKHIMLEPETAGRYTAKPDRELALKTMAMAWPVYNNELYPRRAASDYMNARTKIYIEVMESQDDLHRIMIGHSVFTLPQDIENGRLSWLAGFASGLTEVVYLGKAWSNPDNQTNKRIAFFEQEGFAEAATDYRAFSYPTTSTAVQEKLLDHARAVPKGDMTQDQLKQYIRNAEGQLAVSMAIAEGRNTSSYLPPLLRHRDAWNAYIQNCIKTASTTTPPEWILSEFLEPLGFNQAVVRGLREDS